jgi:hypothetical protein
MTVDSVTTETTTERDSAMTMTEETTTTDTMREWVAELRELAPATAEVRRLWARFDAVQGAAWLADDVLATYNANKGKRRRYDMDRPGLMLGMRGEDGAAWWTDSYRLHRQGSGRGWEVPAVRGDASGVLALDEWLGGPELAEVVRSGGPIAVAPTREAVDAVRALLADQHGKAARKLMSLATACETVAPKFWSLLQAAEGRPETVVAPTRLAPQQTGDLAVLEDGQGLAVSVNLSYLAAFHPDCVFHAHDGLKPVRAVVDGRTVGLLMPVRFGDGTSTTYQDDDGVLFGRAVRDMVDAKLWNGKKMLAEDPRVFELLRKLDVMAPR